MNMTEERSLLDSAIAMLEHRVHGIAGRGKAFDLWLDAFRWALQRPTQENIDYADTTLRELIRSES